MNDGASLDLHVHSDRSPDSKLPIDTIASRVRALGLAGFALTDHNTVAGHATLRTVAGRFPELVCVPGVEVSTAEGHLLAYGVDVPPPPGRSVAETIDWVRARGGEPVLAHPYRWHGAGDTVSRRADVWAVEARNGQSSGRANRAADRLAGERKIGRIGGSDAHTAEAIGRAFTVVEGAIRSLDDLLEAIRLGRVRADGRSLGPLGRLRWTVRNGLLRASRGFRNV